MTTPQPQNLIYITARISFPWLVEPQSRVNEKGVTTQSYNADLIVAPNDPSFAKFMQEYAKMAGEKWKENAQAAMTRIQSDRKTRCYGAGEEKVDSKTFQVRPGYAGNLFITARSSRQPQIIKPDGTPVDPTNTLELRAFGAKIYGGCWVNAVIKPWIQQNDTGIGCRCDLVAVQFARDDEAFGAGAVDTTGMFGQVQGVAAPAMPGMPGPGLPFAAAPAMPQVPFPTAPGMPSFM